MAINSYLPNMLARLTPEEREHVTLEFPTSIHAFLRDVAKKDVHLTVFYNGKHFFVSHLFEVTLENCVMDAPPSVIKPALKPEDLLHIMGTLEQVPFHFTVRAYTIIFWKGYPALNFALPTSLIRLQRRSSFRLIIPLGAHLMASYSIKDERHEGRVADISTGGIRLTDLSPLWLKDLSRGQTIIVSIELDGIQFRLDTVVTNAQALRFASGRVVGQLCLRFKDISPQVENHIARFLLRHEVLFAR